MAQISNDRFVYGQCDTGGKFIKVAKSSSKCDIRTNGGSHVDVKARIYNDQGKLERESSMAIPDHKLGKGLACKIWKWFKVMGLLGVLIWALTIIF